jgi:hypothetical protein
MSDRAIIAAALIVGGAIVAASFYGHSRFALSAANNNVAWRMDTWSGKVDLCAATYLPNGPLVRCGAIVVVPQQQDGDPVPATPPEPRNAPAKEL